MKYLLFFSIILLFIFPIYSNENEDNEKSETILIQEENSENDEIITENPENNNYWYKPYRLYGPWINIAFSNNKLETENFILGLNLTKFSAPPGGMIIFYNIQTLGLEYQQYNNLGSILRSNYSIFGYFALFGGGVGMSIFYNMNNNDIGIAPQIGMSLFLGYVIINYYNRYNFVLNNNKIYYQETIISINIGHWALWGWENSRKRTNGA